MLEVLQFNIAESFFECQNAAKCKAFISVWLLASCRLDVVLVPFLQGSGEGLSLVTLVFVDLNSAVMRWRRSRRDCVISSGRLTYDCCAFLAQCNLLRDQAPPRTHTTLCAKNCYFIQDIWTLCKCKRKRRVLDVKNRDTESDPKLGHASPRNNLSRVMRPALRTLSLNRCSIHIKQVSLTRVIVFSRENQPKPESTQCG